MLCPHCQIPMPANTPWATIFKRSVHCPACGQQSFMDSRTRGVRGLWTILVILVPLLFIIDLFWPAIPASILGIAAFMALLLLPAYLTAGKVPLLVEDTDKRVRRLQHIGSGLLLLFIALAVMPINTHLSWVPAPALLILELSALAVSGYCLLSARRPGDTGG